MHKNNGGESVHDIFQTMKCDK